MSKQLYVYMLPKDIEQVIAALVEKVHVAIMSPTASHPEPRWAKSALRSTSVLPSEEATSVHCCLVAEKPGKIKFKHYPKQSIWRVTDDSEVMFFSGCDFDGEVLVRGRFYCQTDMLEGGHIVPKSSEFIRWTDAVLRLAKRNLQRVADLDAYVGPEAAAWRQNGGRFASLVLPGHGIVPAPREVAGTGTS